MRAPFALALATSLAACTTPDPTTDAGDAIAPVDGSDASSDLTLTPDVTDAPDPHDGARLPRCEDTEPMGEPAVTPFASTLLGTIQPTASIVTTPDLSGNPVFEHNELTYRMRGFDRYVNGPAQTRVQRIDLGSSPTPPTDRHSLAYFVHLSDTQLVDDESPSRLALFESPRVDGGIRPQEAFLPMAISAMNRTLAALQRPERPFQFGLFAGDCADSAQTNELQWFMSIMNGERVETDSGNDDDPIAGPDNDPKDPFTPVGFPAPWYFVPGNHDLEVVGVAAVDSSTRDRALGNYSNAGTRDYTQWWAEPRRGSVVPDAQRALLDRGTIAAMMLTGASTPGPVGHGYTAGQDVSAGANYVVDVIPNLLRIIALDTSDQTGGSPGMVDRSVVDAWLRPQLDRAQTDGVLVMLASHHPTADIDTTAGEIGANVPTAVPGHDLEVLVASYSNVIAWLVGHEHTVRIRAIHGADAAHPGYWEIQSGSIADFPSQSRVIELVDNGNGTLSILGTMVDYDARSCPERRFRRLAIMDMLSGWTPDHRGTDEDRNVDLVIPIPPTVASHVTAALATAPTRIESETTLRGMR